MKKVFKYWTFIIIFCYGLTVGSQIIMRLFWFIKANDHTGLTEFEMVFTIFFLPLVLILVVYRMTMNFNYLKWSILTLPIIYSCIYISARLHFLNWADSVGSRLHPDNDTLLIVELEWLAGFVVTTVGVVICAVRLFWKRKKYSKLT